jgi:hypothetical protein
MDSVIDAPVLVFVFLVLWLRPVSAGTRAQSETLECLSGGSRIAFALHAARG